jgi:hypothetical protein
MKDGAISSLFINKTTRLPIGKWLEAKLYPTRGFKTRKGWHCMMKPKAPHLSKNNRVWVKVEVKDYEFFERPKSQGGVWVLAQKMRVIEEITHKKTQNKMKNLGEINFGKSGTKFIRAWDNSIWDDKARDHLMLANINSENGEISWWVNNPNDEQRQAVQKYASQFIDDDLLMLELEAEAVLVLQKQKKSHKQSNKKSSSSKKQVIYIKAIEELKYDSEKTFCQIIESISKRELSEDEKQEYIAMLVNDTENKIKFKAGNKILKNEYTMQAVFPPMMKVSEPKDLSFRNKVVSIAKYSSNPKDEVRPVMKYVYHDKNEIVATDGFQLVVIHVDKERDNTYYDYSGTMTFPRETFPKYKNVIPKRIENNNILDLKLLIEQIKGVDKANSFFNKKTNELPAVKLLFKANEQQIFTSPKVTLKALMSLWMSGVTAVDVSVTSKNSVMFHDADDDKTLAVVMAIMSGTDTLFTPILGNGIN